MGGTMSEQNNRDKNLQNTGSKKKHVTKYEDLSEEQVAEVKRKQKKLNEPTTKLIAFIFFSALFTIIGSLFLKIFSSEKSPEISEYALMASIVIVLGVLAAHSIIFYQRVLILIRENSLGRGISVTLSVTLLILVLLIIFKPLYVVIGIAVISISVKAGQLYYFVKKYKIGEKLQSYFGKIYVLYFILSLFTFGIFLYVDLEQISILNSIGENVNFDKLKDAIVSLDIDESKQRTILSGLEKFKSDYDDKEYTAIISLFALGYVFLLLIIWLAYRLSLFKTMTSDIIGEIVLYFYNNPPTNSNSDDGSGNKSSKMISFLLITRPLISIIAGLVSVSIYLFTIASPDLIIGVLLFFTVFLTSAYGFVLNDYCDKEKDKSSIKFRILPSGLLHPSSALIYAIILGLSSLIVALNISSIVFMLNLTTIFLLSIYSKVNNNNGIIANCISATTSSFVIVIGMLAGNFNYLILWLAISAFLFFVGREIILDIRDIDSDKIIKKISVPILLGSKRAIYLTIPFFVLSSLITISMINYFNSIWYTLFIGIIFNLLVWSSFLSLLVKRNEKALDIFLVVSRISFLLIPIGLLLKS